MTDAAATRSKAEFLAKSKPVLDGLKRESSAFAEQSRLSDEVLSAVLRRADSSSLSGQPSTTQSAAELARDLRQRLVAEKKSDRALVFKRALGGVFIGSIESGNAALEKKDYSEATQYFACAAEANPESEWVFRQLAVARAFSGDRKGAIEALRSARKLMKDLQTFTEWCKQEAAFTPLRQMADFKAIAE